MKNAFLGKEYTDQEILCALKQHPELDYEIPRDFVAATADCIAQGYIIGWFHGRSEFGPRALGNRSILVDPRKKEMKDILNARVKFREHFRPFAPAVLWEYQSDYFELDISNPYMLLVKNVRKEKQCIIPCVTHVDGTGRIQTVTTQGNPLFYRLIQAFFEVTGVPVLLNTSFNVRGEPIVETPEDALRCFTKTQIDILSIGNYLVRKNNG